MDFSALSEEYKTMSVENDFIDQEYRMISQVRVGVEGLIPFSETFGLTARAEWPLFHLLKGAALLRNKSPHSG